MSDVRCRMLKDKKTQSTTNGNVIAGRNAKSNKCLYHNLSKKIPLLQQIASAEPGLCRLSLPISAWTNEEHNAFDRLRRSIRLPVPESSKNDSLAPADCFGRTRLVPF